MKTSSIGVWTPEQEKCKSMGGSIDTDPGWEDADRWVTAPIPRKVVRQWLREKRERVEDEAHARKVQKGIKKKGSPRKQEKKLKGPGPKTVTKSCEKTTKVEKTSKTSRMELLKRWFGAWGAHP